MKRFFSLYQFVAPAVLLPLAYWLWLSRLKGDHALTLLVVSIPVINSYVVPALGTNYFKLWEFRTKVLVGKFRPHHGFVFGAGMSMLTLICVGDDYRNGVGLLDCLQTAVVAGTFLAFWNWVYDIYAIKAGFLIVHNRVHAAGGTAEAIAMDYAPLYFGLFGACYGVEIRLSEYYIGVLGRTELTWWFLVLFNLATLAIPVLGYMGCYYLRHGELGIWPHERQDGDSGQAAHETTRTS